jgi:sugar lactone lactonase YvrE
MKLKCLLLAVTSLGGLFTGVDLSFAEPICTPYTFTTIAGSAGYGSADGTNSAARFNDPTGLAVDSAGNLYVSDEGNYTIRKITPVGTNWVVTTMAGLAGSPGTNDGTGASARFNGPAVAAVDSAGNLYVGDSGNETIRKMTLSGTNWAVTTLAGQASTGSADGTGSAAKFNLPQCVAADSAGNLYVADTQNCTIRQVTPSGTNWVVTTLAGLAGFSGSADGTGESARFSYYASAVAVDSAGNVYVADEWNNSIRKGYPAPMILNSGPALGFTARQFGFDLTGPPGQLVIVEASTDLYNWRPIWTNTFGVNALPFTDPQASLYSHRFYRTRLP